MTTRIYKTPLVFWKDINAIYCGASDSVAATLGLSSPNDMIGKTIFEFLFDKKEAEIINENDNRVMRKNITQIVEEVVYGKTYYSQKNPLHDSNGNVVGMIGFCINITENKKKEEPISKKDLLLKSVFQAAHDIRSPLASLQMFTRSCESLPEEDRVFLMAITTRIEDIANSLLIKNKKT